MPIVGNVLIDAMGWIMLVSGILTCTMVQAAIAPKAALRFMFGDTLQGPLAEIIVRNWGALIGLVGIMLIYGAYDLPGRRFILIVAGASKLIFILLMFTFGRPYLGRQVRVAVAVDFLNVLLYAGYLVAAPAL